jgi:hypothetical protein
MSKIGDLFSKLSTPNATGQRFPNKALKTVSSKRTVQAGTVNRANNQKVLQKNQRNTKLQKARGIQSPIVVPSKNKHINLAGNNSFGLYYHKLIV